MFYLLAYENEMVNKSTEWMEGASRWGLGIVLAILVLIIFSFVLFKVLKNVDKDRDTYLKLLDKKDCIITNHLSHIENNMSKVDVTLGQLIISSNKNSDKIVSAIYAQTKLLEEKFN